MLEPLINAVCRVLDYIIKFEIRPRKNWKYTGKSVSSRDGVPSILKWKRKRKKAGMENKQLSLFVTLK
jgi:hypothetical protein